jgi:hypothetical protein
MVIDVNLLDSGTWTYDVPSAHVRVVAKLQSGHHQDFAQGVTQEGQRVQLWALGGLVRLYFVDSAACFTFPAETRHRHAIAGVAYEPTCDSGLRYWARARKGKRCSTR